MHDNIIHPHLTELELADRQRRSVKTVQADRLKGGGIPYIKFGKSVRYRLADVERWEQANQFVSTSQYPSGAGASSMNASFDALCGHDE